MRTNVIGATWAILRRAWCSHADALLEHRGGAWYYVCECGHRSPVIRRDRD